MPVFEYRQAEEIRDALESYGFRYLFIGQSAAILLEIPDTTQDADIFSEKSPKTAVPRLLSFRTNWLSKRKSEHE